MTTGDFILSILASALATAFYKYGEKVLVYIRNEPFRNTWDWAEREATALRRPIVILHALMPILIISFVLALAPKSFAPVDEFVLEVPINFNVNLTDDVTILFPVKRNPQRKK